MIASLLSRISRNPPRLVISLSDTLFPYRGDKKEILPVIECVPALITRPSDNSDLSD